jgi:tetratricopeptide (TPR) repeat protein
MGVRVLGTSSGLRRVDSRSREGTMRIFRSCGGVAAFRRTGLAVFLLCASAVFLPSCLPQDVSSVGAPPAVGGQAQEYFNAGLKLYKRDRYIEAAQFFERALELDPGMVVARRAVADCYLEAGAGDKQSRKLLYEKAKQHAKILIETDTETVDGYCVMGVAVFNDDEKAAIPYLEKVINSNINLDKSFVFKKKSDYYGVMSILGSGYGITKDYEKSIFYYKKFIAACANDRNYADQASHAQRLVVKMERLVAAKKAYESSVRTTLAAPAVKQAEPEKTKPAGPGKKTISPVTPTRTSFPSPPAAAPQDANTARLKQEYEKAKEDMEKAFKDRGKQVEMLTG